MPPASDLRWLPGSAARRLGTRLLWSPKTPLQVGPPAHTRLDYPPILPSTTSPYSLGPPAHTRLDHPPILAWTTRPYSLGLPAHTRLDHPPILPWTSRPCSLGPPAHTLLDHPPILTWTTRPFSLGPPAHTLLDYPPILLADGGVVSRLQAAQHRQNVPCGGGARRRCPAWAGRPVPFDMAGGAGEPLRFAWQ